MYACKYTRDSDVDITYIFMNEAFVFLHAKLNDITEYLITTEYDADCDLKNREFINVSVNEVTRVCKIDCIIALFTKVSIYE